MLQSRRRAHPIRALVLALVAVVGTPVAAGGQPLSAAIAVRSPFINKVLYVDLSSNAARDAAALAATDPLEAAAVRKIATHSQADWFGDWNPIDRVATDVSNRVATITSAGAYPVFVAYDIPERDCHGFSGGGAPSADAYRAWVRAFTSGIGTHAAAVILEPDALAQLDCLGAADQQTRVDLIKYATQTLTSTGKVAVYLDAGNAGWIPVAVMADRLSKAGIASARGFALNVSNFGWTADEIAYGRQISALVGAKRFVVDTSRNGNGPATGIGEPWCNPPGRALGITPTGRTGDALVDAELWIKRPGESDGTCNGGPPAGTWWRDAAAGLGQRAAW